MVTRIQITEETKQKLKQLRGKGESYDDIIKRLVNIFEGVNRENLIENRWNKFQLEKEQYNNLD